MAKPITTVIIALTKFIIFLTPLLFLLSLTSLSLSHPTCHTFSTEIITIMVFLLLLFEWEKERFAIVRENRKRSHNVFKIFMTGAEAQREVPKGFRTSLSFFYFIEERIINIVKYPLCSMRERVKRGRERDVCWRKKWLPHIVQEKGMKLWGKRFILFFQEISLESKPQFFCLFLSSSNFFLHNFKCTIALWHIIIAYTLVSLCQGRRKRCETIIFMPCKINRNNGVWASERRKNREKEEKQ